MPSTVGLALIVKNEEKNLPTLLESIEGAFDQVVLIDTGSTDHTLDIFDEWASEQQIHTIVGYYEWNKDFAAARNYADSFLDTNWNVWADADDIIVGAQNIRSLVENLDPSVVALAAGYDYIQHPDTGECICFLKRERVVRKGHGTWNGRVHEAQQVQGGMIQYVGPELLLWKHNKAMSTVEEVRDVHSTPRNLEILEEWYKDEPNNARVVAYLGTENAARGDHETALRFYNEYMQTNPSWPDEKSQVVRKACTSMMALGADPDDVIRSAWSGLDANPDWPDTALTLAEAYLVKGEYNNSISWASRVISAGVPDTLLIINPLEYTFVPRRIKAQALAAQGNYSGAVAMADEALGCFPDHGLMIESVGWRKNIKREHTAETWCMAAIQLVNHDEQIKALALLEDTVPHFAQDHPKIVAMRSELRERLHWVDDPDDFADHYENGGSKPEDFIPDNEVDSVCERLPRAGFLLDGIKEQMTSA